MQYCRDHHCLIDFGIIKTRTIRRDRFILVSIYRTYIHISIISRLKILSDDSLLSVDVEELCSDIRNFAQNFEKNSDYFVKLHNNITRQCDKSNLIHAVTSNSYNFRVTKITSNEGHFKPKFLAFW